MAHDPWQNAVAQLTKVAELIKLTPAQLERITQPERVVQVHFRFKWMMVAPRCLPAFAHSTIARGPYRVDCGLVLM